MFRERWKTAVTRVEPNKLLMRGYPLDELIGHTSFTQGIYLAIKGELPGERQTRLLDAILVSAIDHGVTSPSCVAARTIASTRSSVSASLAGGILSISTYHGGATEDAMRLFIEAVNIKKQISAEQAASQIVSGYLESGKRLPGYGHRFHSKDPRVLPLLRYASEMDFSGEYVKMAKLIEKAVEETLGRHLPLNIDGAIGAILCEMQIPEDVASAFFILARLPGLVAHVHEERKRMRPMRHINSRDHEYDGPDERRLT